MITSLPINGGVRILPGKLSPEDASPATRRNVKLVATIEPPIAGVTVYFKVWDVDDPFDQVNNTMPDVGLIDSDMVGKDNRPVGEGPWEFTAPTDAQGRASVVLEVSMQPGNNYRAAATVLPGVLNGSSQQVSQTDTEVCALIQACSRYASTGLRNRALFALLYRAGLRINEARSLHPNDPNLADGCIRVLNGEGRRSRTVGLDPGAAAIIERWLDARSGPRHGRSATFLLLAPWSSYARAVS